MEQERRCDLCSFWVGSSQGKGSCRRHPPRPTGATGQNDLATNWPLVFANDWCGEFDLREKPKGVRPVPLRGNC